MVNAFLTREEKAKKEIEKELEYTKKKTIIQDLDNSDEYVRQRVIDYLEEEKNGL